MTLKKSDWLFHKLAPFYDHLIRTPQVDRLKGLLKLSKDNYLLDLGGGTGRVSHHFTGLGAEVLVCDINRSMLKQVKSNLFEWSRLSRELSGFTAIF